MKKSITARSLLLCAIAGMTIGSPVAAADYQGNADDYAQINQLMQKYNYTLDIWDPEGWASVFTENGTFHFGRGCIAGRTALAALIAKMKPDYANKAVQQHIATPGFITYTDKDHAQVHSAILLTGVTGWIRPLEGAAGLAFTGAYDDTLVRVNGRWLIADRTENDKTADYKAPAPCAPKS